MTRPELCNNALDCAHFGDLIPGSVVSMSTQETYRDWEYVKKEVGNLAAQLKKKGREGN